MLTIMVVQNVKLSSGDLLLLLRMLLMHVLGCLIDEQFFEELSLFRGCF